MESIILSQDQRLALLTEREHAAYRLYLTLCQPPMAASTQEKFFRLFLGGINCEEILRVNPGGFSLGALVRARVENNWDEKRLEHQRNLAATVRGNVQQTVLETVEQLALELKVHNKLKRDRLLRFLQTGDEKELEGLGVGSTKNLKDVAEALLKLTGQGENKTVGGVIEHRHVVDPSGSGKGITPEQAEIILRALNPK